MDPEIKRQLEEIHALVKDNHRIVKDVRRHQLLSAYGKLVIWLVILLGSGYLLDRYLVPLATTFSQSSGMHASGPFGLPTSVDIQNLINSYKVKP